MYTYIGSSRVPCVKTKNNFLLRTFSYSSSIFQLQHVLDNMVNIQPLAIYKLKYKYIRF